MTIHTAVTPAALSPSWPLRWEAAKGKGRAHEDYILRTIAAEAARDETAIFMAAMNAADADAECRDEFLAELKHLFLRAECEEEFDEWRGRDWRGREDEDFGDWLERESMRPGGEKYAEAMNWRERRAAHRRGEGGRI